MQNYDWDVYRYVVAVADAGSALAAADMLGVDGSTVIRRIKRFEEERAVRLFDRLATGYAATVIMALLVVFLWNLPARPNRGST